MENFWDLRYSEPGFAYGKEPNEFFRQQIDRLETGRVLLPGEGEGRNAIYAARQGWEVTAFDQSSVARQKAMTWAEEEGLSISYLNADLADYDCGRLGGPGGWTFDDFAGMKNGFDLIAVIYIHLPPRVRTYIHRKMLECLRPGGRFILECFHAGQLEYGTGGPPVRELLYTVDELQSDFRDMKIEKCENILVEREEGPYHSGTSSIIQLIAIK
jgi:SAM-dependent methyltransferase